MAETDGRIVVARRLETSLDRLFAIASGGVDDDVAILAVQIPSTVTDGTR